jgi:hypothetical protein
MHAALTPTAISQTGKVHLNEQEHWETPQWLCMPAMPVKMNCQRINNELAQQWLLLELRQGQSLHHHVHATKGGMWQLVMLPTRPHMLPAVVKNRS